MGQQGADLGTQTCWCAEWAPVLTLQSSGREPHWSAFLQRRICSSISFVFFLWCWGLAWVGMVTFHTSWTCWDHLCLSHLLLWWFLPPMQLFQTLTAAFFSGIPQIHAMLLPSWCHPLMALKGCVSPSMGLGQCDGCWCPTIVCLPLPPNLPLRWPQKAFLTQEVCLPFFLQPARSCFMLRGYLAPVASKKVV